MRRMTLTPAINLTYANPITAKSVVRFRILSKQERTSAHLKRFFCACLFSMVGCVGASSDAPALLPGNANPAQPATLLLRINHGGSSQQQEIITMNVFTVRDAATLPELAEHASIRAVQVQALAETITNLSDAPENFQDRRQFVRISNLMWLLEDLLPQHAEVCAEVHRLVKRGGV